MFSLGHQAQLFGQHVKDCDKNELPFTGRFKQQVNLSISYYWRSIKKANCTKWQELKVTLNMVTLISNSKRAFRELNFKGTSDYYLDFLFFRGKSF